MKKHWLVGGVAGVLALASLAFIRAQDAQQMAAADSPEPYASGQPIAFPHNTHAGLEPGQLAMDCQYCHFSAERSVDAGIPSVELCAGCHQVIPGANKPEEVAKLMEYWNNRQAIPWVRIYKTPDHAHYPHMRHIAAGLQCQQCHGEVQTMDVITAPDPLWGGKNMGWCIECHRTEGASDDCAVCHY
jgi:hypothetical protein